MWEAGCEYCDDALKILSESCDRTELEILTMVAARTFHRSQPSTVQSLLLLGYREFGIGSMEHGWLYIGALLNMCDGAPGILKHRIGMAIRMV